MTNKTSFVAVAAMVGMLLLGSPGAGQAVAQDVVDSSTNVLNEFMKMPNGGIPRSMLAKAEGLVIVPSMLKVGFVAGVRRGKGIAVVKDDHGAWRPPTFLTMTGGSVGWQIGVQSTDVILVFQTRKSINGLMSGKFTIGVDAAAAAGPVGRQAAAATDGKLQAEILSYSRGRGLFVGAAVDGSVIQIDAATNQAYYQPAGMTPNGTPITPNAQLPASSARLLSTLGSYTGSPVSAPGGAAIAGGVVPPSTLPPTGSPTTVPGMGTTPPNAVLPPATWTGTNAPSASPTTVPGPSAANSSPPNAGAPAAGGVFPPGVQPPTVPVNAGAAANREELIERTRRELAASAQKLGTLLDDSWRRYFSLPNGVYSGNGVPSMESLQQALHRFDSVAKDAKYAALLERPEFQQAYGLLRTYTEQVRSLKLPAGTIPSAGAGSGTSIR